MEWEQINDVEMRGNSSCTTAGLGSFQASPDHDSWLTLTPSGGGGRMDGSSTTGAEPEPDTENMMMQDKQVISKQFYIVKFIFFVYTVKLIILIYYTQNEISLYFIIDSVAL